MLGLVTIAITLLCTININCLPGDDVAVVPQNRMFEDKIKEAIETALKTVPDSYTYRDYDFKLPSPWSGRGTVTKFKLSGLNTWEVSDVYGRLEMVKLSFGAKIVYRKIDGAGNYTARAGLLNSYGFIRSDFSDLIFVIKGSVNPKKQISVTAEVTLNHAAIEVVDLKMPLITSNINKCLQKDFANYVNNHKSKISQAVNAILEELIKKKHSSFTILADKLAKQIKQ